MKVDLVQSVQLKGKASLWRSLWEAKTLADVNKLSKCCLFDLKLGLQQQLAFGAEKATASGEHE